MTGARTLRLPPDRSYGDKARNALRETTTAALSGAAVVIVGLKGPLAFYPKRPET
jgi:hypothetical protein